ncbi:hypothetical protein CG51_01510 [Haematobacter missouriensis]|nr:hypothetical protein CG51_01510 [Haematobacter missouriensis]
MAPLHGTDASRRARHDEITGSQFEETGQMRDHIGHGPDLIGQIAGLAKLSIHRQRDGAVVRVADLGHGMKGGYRRGVVRGLCRLPWATGLLCLRLKVSAGHVEADAIAIDVIQRLDRGDVAPALRQSDDQFDFMVQVGGAGGIGEDAFRRQVVGILLEEERRLLAGMAHFARVFGIVAPDAIDAADGEKRGLPRDGKGRGARRWDHVGVGHEGLRSVASRW